MQVRRRGARARSLLAGVVVATVVGAAPARAVVEDGADPGEPISLLPAVLIFVGIPLVTYLVVMLLVYAPSRLGRPRYRPGIQDWDYAPVWIGGPADAQTVLTRTPTDVVLDVRGGGAGAGW